MKLDASTDHIPPIVPRAPPPPPDEAGAYGVRPHLDLLIVGIVLAVLFAGMSVAYRWIVIDSERSAVSRTIASAGRDARLLSHDWSEVVKSARGLQVLAQELWSRERAGDKAGADKALADLILASRVSRSGIRSVEAVDPSGATLWHLDTGEPRLEGRPAAADLATILAHRRDRITALAEPRADGEAGPLFFCAALIAPDGTPGGAILVGFSTQELDGLARDVIHRDGDLTLVSRDHEIVVARSDGQMIGQRMPLNLDSPADRDRTASWVGRGAGLVDGAPRIWAMRDIPGSDLSIVLSLDEARALTGAHVYQGRIRAGGAVLAGVIAILGAAVVIMWRQGLDIREARLSAERSEARGDLLRDITTQASDIIIVIDDGLHYVYVNTAGEALFGVPRSELIGKRMGEPDAVKPEAADLPGLKVFLEGDHSGWITVPVHHQSGRAVWVEFTVSHIQLPDLNGRPRRGWMAAGRDVTERRAAEEELRRTHRELRLVADHVPGLMYRAVGAVGRPALLDYISTRDQKLLGHPETVWRAPGFTRSHAHPDDYPVLDRFVEALRRDGEAMGEYRVRDAEGRFVWIRDSATATLSDDGCFAVTGFAQDVTAEKEQAERLDEARRLLALGDLASGVGHELGQPLMAILAAAENARSALARLPASAGRVEEKLDRIQQMAERAGGIVRKMRELGHPDGHKTAKADIPASVSQALSVLRERLENEQIEIRADFPEGLRPVLIAPLLLQQVLINLVANACDAYRDNCPGDGAKEGQARIVEIVAGYADGSLSVQVRDHAGGIPPDALTRLFEPFFTTKGPGRGSGLGLAVSQGIVRRAGGSLIPRNEAGGAVFEIVLPLAASRPGGDLAA